MTLPSQGEAREGEELQPVAVTARGTGPGPLGLVGSGEFTPAMRAVDAALLDHVEAAGFERAVAVIPAAAAPDGDAVVRRWLRMAEDHYGALDADVLPVDVRDRHDATELRQVAEVGEAGLLYLSGGKPDHLVATLRGTPLLDAVLEQWRLGAALVGCSAGAMALTAAWPPFPRMRGRWGTGLGVAPRLAVVPHFDMVRKLTPGAVNRAARHVPEGLRVLGLDEDTALLHTDGWRAEGAGRVWELHMDGPHPVDHATLPSPG